MDWGIGLDNYFINYWTVCNLLQLSSSLEAWVQRIQQRFITLIESTTVYFPTFQKGSMVTHKMGHCCVEAGIHANPVGNGILLAQKDQTGTERFLIVRGFLLDIQYTQNFKMCIMYFKDTWSWWKRDTHSGKNGSHLLDTGRWLCDLSDGGLGFWQHN